MSKKARVLVAMNGLFDIHLNAELVRRGGPLGSDSSAEIVLKIDRGDRVAFVGQNG